MSHLTQNETHRNQQSLAVRSVAKEHQVFVRSSPVEDITVERASEVYLRHLAPTDALTGLANYRTLSETLESEIKRPDRTGRAFAVLIFDLKGMKRNSGRRSGSLPPSRTFSLLLSIDTVARYGGDEFAIILPETGAAVARRIRERLSHDREKPLLSVSIGIAVYPDDAAMAAGRKRAREMKASGSLPGGGIGT